MGRKSKENIILQNLDVIKKLKQQGASDLQIIEHIGICPATFYKFLKTNTQLQEVWNNAKADLVVDLVGELVRKAKPHTLTTTKTIEKNGEIVTEITEKEVDGDLGSLIFLLKNYDREHFTNEPNMLELKRRELELKEKLAEQNNW